MQEGFKTTVNCGNGYQLSIISNEYSYGGKTGLFEVMLLNDTGDLLYEESLGFADVRGWLDFKQVSEIIEEIKKAPPRN